MEQGLCLPDMSFRPPPHCRKETAMGEGSEIHGDSGKCPVKFVRYQRAFRLYSLLVVVFTENACLFSKCTSKLELSSVLANDPGKR